MNKFNLTRFNQSFKITVQTKKQLKVDFQTLTEYKYVIQSQINDDNVTIYAIVSHFLKRTIIRYYQSVNSPEAYLIGNQEVPNRQYNENNVKTSLRTYYIECLNTLVKNHGILKIKK